MVKSQRICQSVKWIHRELFLDGKFMKVNRNNSLTLTRAIEDALCVPPYLADADLLLPALIEKVDISDGVGTDFCVRIVDISDGDEVQDC
ncbi:hypothetical protein Bca101_043047 [Brassica carinata]